jgi:hypothetical protein
MNNARVSRRDVVKLAGIVASLGAGLGVVLESTDAHASFSWGMLQFKFFKLGEGGDESRAELLVTIKLTPEDEARILSVPQGRLQLKICMEQAKVVGSADVPPPTILVKQLIPLDPNRVQGKFKSPPVTLPK